MTRLRPSRALHTLTTLVLGCLTLNEGAAHAQAQPAQVGVLLVNHGSRSAAWRGALLDLDRKTREPLLASGKVHGVKTAFMEYTEPSIATRMKEFDAEGFSDVIVVPIFLTVSTHTFDDIPTILGRKTDAQSLETLRIDGIARYTPRARTHFAPRLDFGAMLKENVLRRARKLSKDPAHEGIVLIAYGDATYDRQWSALMEEVARHVMAETGMGTFSYGWAGHIAHYDPAHTTRAVERVLAKKERAVVVPVFVAFDEMFQVRIIGKGIADVPRHRDLVAYAPDAILPDAIVDRWVVETASSMAGAIAKHAVAATR
jgi:sirohydrochlorin ferrochelatase